MAAEGEVEAEEAGLESADDERAVCWASRCLSCRWRRLGDGDWVKRSVSEEKWAACDVRRVMEAWRGGVPE